MKTIAFYAYKGGTGRTMALLHTAWHLAREGRRVVVVDLDLAAPGVWPLLSDEEPPEGFVELAADWLAGKLRAAGDYLREVRLDSQATGSLFVLGAGRLDRRYLETLQGLDWQKLLDERPIPAQMGEGQLGLFAPLAEKAHFFTKLLDDLKQGIEPDAIFIDAPTGFSEAANLSLRMLADIVVVLFGPTRQQLIGIGHIVDTLAEEQARRRQRGDVPRPEIFCVASALMSRRASGSVIKRVQDAFAFLNKVRFQAAGRPEMTEEVMDAVEQPPAVVAYDAPLADLDRLDLGSAPDDGQLGVYQDILRFVDESVPVRSRRAAAPPLDVDQKRPALAEAQKVFEQFAEREPDKLEQYFLRGAHIERLRDPMSVVVLGGKGSGKTALFLYATRERHTGDVEHVRVHEPGRPLLGPDRFVALDRSDVGLDTLWRVYALAQLDADVPVLSPVVAAAVSALRGLAGGAIDVSDALRALSTPDLPIEVDRAWKAVDEEAGRSARNIVLYFDGLDTVAKGNLDARDRVLRGLFSAWQATFSRLDRVSSKILLRTDLWEQLSFPEKSHLRGRSMRLVWQPPEIWRLVLKRILHCPAFVKLIEGRGLPALNATTIEATSQEVTLKYLDVLFEERIWTGKNSLSRNWILRRLVDANRVIFPRDVLCLLQQAVLVEEQRLQDRARTAPEALLSRESLQRALIPTSKQRVDAVREEYPELVDLLASLSEVNANGKVSELVSHVDHVPNQFGESAIDALRRAGVLAVDGDEYKVPALYHYGLNMIRPGPT